MRIVLKMFVVTVPFLSFLFTAGCVSRDLPKNFSPYIEQRVAKLAPSEGEQSVHQWHAKRRNLRTYWGKKHVRIKVKAVFPEEWQRPGDAAWRVDAHTESGKRLPFVGVLRRYTSQNQNRLAEIVPPLKLSKIRDGLYIVIEPGVTKEEGEIKSIRPVAHVSEIRDHAFQPFRVKIPLSPKKESAITPSPENENKPEREMQGTALPYD